MQSGEQTRYPLHPFSMLLASALGVFLIGLVFQLLAVFSARLFFHVPASDLLDMDKMIAGENLAAVKYIQIVGAIGMFIVGSMVMSFVYTKSWTAYFPFGRKLNMMLVVTLFLVMIIALPAVNFLTDLNTNFTLPFHRLENYFREMESNTEALMMTMLQGDNKWALVVNLFMIAIIPAVGEELLFRGLIQRHLVDWTRNVHLGVFIASVLFSLAHGQIYSFLPRLFLGMLLGYFYVYGRSIWYPMIAHLINNAMGVVFYFVVKDAAETGAIDDLGTLQHLPFAALGSIFIMVVMMLFWKKTAETSPPDPSPHQ